MFVKTLAALVGAAAMPVRVLAGLREEPTVEVQYGHIVYSETWDEEMPSAVRAELDLWADGIAVALGPIVKREYLWIPRRIPDMSDPCCQRAAGAIKFMVASPKRVHDAQRDARILAGGWVRAETHEDRMALQHGVRWEFADFAFDDKPVRYARVWR